MIHKNKVTQTETIQGKRKHILSSKKKTHTHTDTLIHTQHPTFYIRQRRRQTERERERERDKYIVVGQVLKTNEIST